MPLVLNQAMLNSSVGRADRTGSSDCLPNYYSTAHVQRAWCNGHLLYLRTSSWCSFSWWCAHRLKEVGCLRRCDLLSPRSIACQSRPRVFHFGGSHAWGGCLPSWERRMDWTWMHPEVWLGSVESQTCCINRCLLLRGFWTLTQRWCRSWKTLNSLDSTFIHDSGVWVARPFRNLDWRPLALVLERNWAGSPGDLRHLLQYSNSFI